MFSFGRLKNSDPRLGRLVGRKEGRKEGRGLGGVGWLLGCPRKLVNG